MKVELLTDTLPCLGDKLEVHFVDEKGNGQIIVMAKKVQKDGQGFDNRELAWWKDKSFAIKGFNE